MGQRPLRSGELYLGYGAQKCPRCSATQGFRPVTVQDDNMGCLMFFFGGFIPYLLYESSRSDMLACDRCGTVFRAARASTEWGWWSVFVLFLVAGTMAFVFFLWCRQTGF